MNIKANDKLTELIMESINLKKKIKINLLCKTLLLIAAIGGNILLFAAASSFYSYLIISAAYLALVRPYSKNIEQLNDSIDVLYNDMANEIQSICEEAEEQAIKDIETERENINNKDIIFDKDFDINIDIDFVNEEEKGKAYTKKHRNKRK